MVSGIPGLMCENFRHTAAAGVSDVCTEAEAGGGWLVVLSLGTLWFLLGVFLEANVT